MKSLASPRLTGSSNSFTSYGSVERGLHWAVALLLITGAVLGKVAYEWPYDTSEAFSVKARLFSAHKTIGVSVFFLALIRIAWSLSQPRPRPLHPERRWETRLASTVHWMLYGSLVFVPLTGWMHHAASSGFAPIWWPFGQSLPFVPKDPMLSATLGDLHKLFVKVLILSLLLHIAGTLKHVFIDRDLTLPRMWSGRDPQSLPTPKKDRVPMLMAGIIWVIALGLGLTFARAEQTILSPTPPTIETTNETQQSGNWVVLDGTLALTVTQMGQAVSGTFSDWTADIEFDETLSTDGPVGSVRVTINIGSLSLGSVTNEARAPDFLNAAAYPTATFNADILREGETYVADGTLTLRGERAPVRLPFTLAIRDGVAILSGQTVLDRRSFGVGETYPDESNVGFSVQVDVDLTAQKS